jgi:FHS family Na+ dependent glucose MFS transporter 1
MEKERTQLKGGLLTSPGRQFWFKTGSVYFIYLVLGMTMASLGPTINDVSAANGVTTDEFSIIFIFRALAAFIGSFFGMPLYDRYRAKTLLLFVLPATAAFYFGIPLLTNFIVTIFFFFILGISFSMLNASGNIIITRIHGKKSAPFLSGLHFSFGIGAFLIPLIISQIRLYTGTSIYSYWVIAGSSLLAALFIALLPHFPEGRKVKEREKAAKDTRWLFIGLALVFQFFFVGVEIAFGTWIYNYALIRNVADKQTADLLTSLFYGVYTATRFIIIPVAARVDNKKIIIVFLCGGLLAHVFLLVSPAVTWIIFALTAAVGFFLAPVVPTSLAFVEKRLGLTGKIAGWLQIGMVGGGMLFPWIIGQLLKPGGHFFFPLILALAQVSALVIGIAMVSIKIKK